MPVSKIPNHLIHFSDLHPGQDLGQGLDQVHLQDQGAGLKLVAKDQDQDQVVVVVLIEKLKIKRICFENMYLKIVLLSGGGNSITRIKPI